MAGILRENQDDLREDFHANDRATAKLHAANGLAAGLAALAALSAGSSALAAWPERNITLIACFPAGGGTDIAARLIATPLGEALGQPVIVENRGGAGGSIGTAVAMRARRPTATPS